jgi:hypothetical protein
VRELKSLQAAIDAASELQMSKEEIVNAIAKIRVEWSWAGSDENVAGRVNVATKLPH